MLGTPKAEWLRIPVGLKPLGDFNSIFIISKIN